MVYRIGIHTHDVLYTVQILTLPVTLLYFDHSTKMPDTFCTFQSSSTCGLCQGNVVLKRGLGYHPNGLKDIVIFRRHSRLVCAPCVFFWSIQWCLLPHVWWMPFWGRLTRDSRQTRINRSRKIRNCDEAGSRVVGDPSSSSSLYIFGTRGRSLPNISACLGGWF